MDVWPRPADFAGAYERSEPQLVWARRIADLETPVTAYAKLAEGRVNCFLLESVLGGETRGRYSVIGLEPDLIWRADGARAEVNRRPAADSDAFAPCRSPTLESLRALLAESALKIPEGLAPLAAGVFGYLGYDAARLMERLPAPNPGGVGAPDAMFVRPTVVAVFDAVAQEIVLSTPARPAEALSAGDAYAAARARLAEAARRLDGPAPPLCADGPASGPGLEFVSNTSERDFLQMVRRAKDYISAGDIFQVVLSQRFSAPFSEPPFALYRALRRMNPAPFLFFLDFDVGALVGSSPEILVRVREGVVTVRPIAGTRPRGATQAQDRAFERELLADPKERAEHLMLLDLGRNDVGRAAAIGSVQVTEQYAIERYSHVMHIVSEVQGRLKDGLDALDALIGGFPAGTVSGAPKIRAMEIIDELETENRGPYAGAVGYFSAAGDMDTCIVLRTAFVKDGVAHVQAGAGVVADSDPQAEYRETLAKAEAVMAAAREARRLSRASQDETPGA